MTIAPRSSWRHMNDIDGVWMALWVTVLLPYCSDRRHRCSVGAPVPLRATVGSNGHRTPTSVVLVGTATNRYRGERRSGLLLVTLMDIQFQAQRQMIRAVAGRGAPEKSGGPPGASSSPSLITAKRSLPA